MAVTGDDWLVLSGIAAVVISLGALWIEARRIRKHRDLDLILYFGERFNDAGMVRKRQVAARFLRDSRTLPADDPSWEDADDVIDFLELIGTASRTGHLSPRLVHRFFFPWYACYWQASRGYIEEVRAEMPLVWANAEWIYERMAAEEWRMNEGKRNRLSDEHIDRFLAGETALEPE